MRLNSILIIYGGGPGSGCNPEVGKCGRPSTGKDESEGFFSPNTEEGLKFEDAFQRLNSPEQQQAISRAQTLINKVFGSGTVQNAIGDWKDGAENSAVVTVPGHDKNALDFTLATLGKELNQKSVLSFAHDEAGDDRLYALHSTQDVQKIRDVLDKAGIGFRTIVPEANGGTTVHVFDQGGKMLDNIGQAGIKMQADGMTVIGGKGNFIGGDTREEGQSQYEQVIRRYQKASGIRAASYQWYTAGNRNRLRGWRPPY